jgi:hypothetical protein
MSMSDAFLPEGGRGAAPHNDPLEREDVDLDDETGVEVLSDDVFRGPGEDESFTEDEPPARPSTLRPPTGRSVDPSVD